VTLIGDDIPNAADNCCVHAYCLTYITLYVIGVNLVVSLRTFVRFS